MIYENNVRQRSEMFKQEISYGPLRGGKGKLLKNLQLHSCLIINKQG